MSSWRTRPRRDLNVPTFNQTRLPLPPRFSSRSNMSKCIAVLITCHNRQPRTLKCLDILLKQDLPTGLRLDIYLVDDGSSDGTSDAVREAFPEVHVIPGDGSLFWSGGMCVAWQYAAKA